MREAYIIIIFSILIHQINGQQMELIAGHVVSLSVLEETQSMGNIFRNLVI